MILTARQTINLFLRLGVEKYVAANDYAHLFKNEGLKSYAMFT